MSDTLRIGMIGCGEIAVRTAEGIAAAENAAHVMVMDVSEAVAKDMGERHGVPHTTDVNQLLANPDVDAVYIAVPHYLHAPLAIQALEAGKHVLVEKPIATTLADADRMLAAAREAGRTLSVAFSAQIDPLSQTVRRLIAEGAIGKVLGTRIAYRGAKPESYWRGGYTGRITTDWRVSKEKSGGGILIMNAIHDLNTTRFVTGLEAVRVYAEYDTYTTPVEVEDYVAVTYRYDNGAIGTIEAGSAIPGRDPHGAFNRIYGERGQIIFPRPPKAFLTADFGDLKAGEWHDIAVPPRSGPERKLMIEGFARAVLARETPPVTGEDGRAALEIVVAAYRSGELHQPVTLPLRA
ncbi:MAG: Gfo/Idh/MocA family oxidoreductase [Chloroflexi bacterium]|nr:Gfo/Idh/MocA family oxidoreductase [Chloroflexota bacterium]